MRTVTVELKSILTIQMEEGIEVQEVINEMEYDFKSSTTNAEIINASIEDYEVTNSK